MDETHTEQLRRAVKKFIDAGCPFGQVPQHEVIEWLAIQPAKVREAIFLILDGHYAQDHRAHLKGAKTARERRK